MSKEKRPIETKGADPQLNGYFNPNDRLSLSKELKDWFKAQGMDFRFLNAPEFRRDGGYHPTQWLPFDAREAVTKGLDPKFTVGMNAEGQIQRGDLILGYRPKALTAQYNQMVKQRNERYSKFNKTEAQKLREHARSVGLGEAVTIHEGYDDKSR